jgi:hypothetical protein
VEESRSVRRPLEEYADRDTEQNNTLLWPRLLKGIILILRRDDIVFNLVEHICFVKSEKVT